MSLKRLIQKFDEWKPAGETMVLGTVVVTEGSTYSKPGQRILIDHLGNYQGLVSGGCLEGDLAEHAAMVVDSGQAKTVTYDMRGEDDELFGLGIGCDGMLEILLQPLVAAEGYAPFPTIAGVLAGDTTETAVAVISAEPTGPAAGSTLVTGADRDLATGMNDQWVAAARDIADPRIRIARVTEIVCAGARARVLVDPIAPLPTILVVGAGADAVPLVTMAHELGWRIVIADHRAAYLSRRGFDIADARIEFEPGHLKSSYNPDEADACVVMTHHLATDRACLAELANCTCTYIGVLGPAARRQRLLADLGEKGEPLSKRLKGPVGLDIGADTPEAIALSILTEIYSTLHRAGRAGRRTAAND